MSQYNEAAYAIALATSYNTFDIAYIPSSYMRNVYAIALTVSYNTFSVEASHIPLSCNYVTSQHMKLIILLTVVYNTFSTKLPSTHDQAVSQYREAIYMIALVVSDFTIGASYIDPTFSYISSLSTLPQVTCIEYD